MEAGRRIFIVACGHFFDDYACIDPKVGDGTAKESLWVVHDVLCCQLSVPKSVKEKYVNPFLGVVTDLSGLKRKRRVTRLAVKPGRAVKLRAILVGVLGRMVLTSSHAARLRGKLYFLTPTPRMGGWEERLSKPLSEGSTSRRVPRLWRRALFCTNACKFSWLCLI